MKARRPGQRRRPVRHAGEVEGVFGPDDANGPRSEEPQNSERIEPRKRTDEFSPVAVPVGMLLNLLGSALN